LIFDSDVLIWAFRGKESASKLLLSVENFSISAVTYMELADALIAATAVENGEILCTANGKHYKCVQDLKLDVFKVE